MIALIDLLYFSIVMPLARVMMTMASLLHSKLATRRSYVQRTWETVRSLRARDTVWVHAASAGEYEQIVPIIQRLRERGVQVVGTAFSPSGYEHQERLALNDATLMLPLDGRADMRRLFDAIQPRVILISRYDLWRGMVLEAEQRMVPIMIVNATCPSAADRAVIGPWITDSYQRVAHITAVSDAEARGIASMLGHAIEVAPDTRVARVAEKAAHPDPSITRWRRDTCTTLICASTWKSDEDLIFHALGDDIPAGLRLIIVPHEPEESTLRRIEAVLPCRRWSTVQDQDTTDSHLLVDRTGSLLSFYAIADAAYVGGGFGAGVHSVMEPAAYGLALCSGPAVERSQIASELAGTEALHVVRDAPSLRAWIENIVRVPNERHRCGGAARQWIDRYQGGVDTAMRLLETYL